MSSSPEAVQKAAATKTYKSHLAACQAVCASFVEPDCQNGTVMALQASCFGCGKRFWQFVLRYVRWRSRTILFTHRFLLHRVGFDLCTGRCVHADQSKAA